MMQFSYLQSQFKHKANKKFWLFAVFIILLVQSSFWHQAEHIISSDNQCALCLVQAELGSAQLSCPISIKPEVAVIEDCLYSPFLIQLTPVKIYRNRSPPTLI